jgi:hypothetical protein
MRRGKSALVKFFPRAVRLTFFVSVCLLLFEARAALAQAPQPTAALEVIATNGAGREKHLPSINGVVPMLMVRPNQTVPVTLQFPTSMAGTPVAATPLDGGRIGGDGNGVVLPTGRMLFTFSPGAMPGRYRVMLYLPGQQHLLEFYVVDPNHSPWQQRPGSSH